MKKSAYELILQRTHEVVRAASLFLEFECVAHFSLRIENEPWMPLVVESWPASDPLLGERRRVLVAHYFTEGNRTFADPELEMTDGGFPVRLKQWGLGQMEYRILWRDERSHQVLINTAAKRDIAELLGIWAKNIKEQGFITAASRIVATGSANPAGGQRSLQVIIDHTLKAGDEA